MDRKDFKKLFSEILDELPEDFSKKIENVAFIMEEEPSRELKSSEDLDENSLLHEIAHYFGISDKRLHEIGAY